MRSLTRIWQAFLSLKTSGDEDALVERTGQIESWFAQHPIRPVTLSADALKLRDEIEVLIEQFHKKCNELKVAVRRSEHYPIDNNDASLAADSRS